MIDEGKLNVFIGQILGDLGGASSVAMVRLGGSLGVEAMALYRYVPGKDEQERTDHGPARSCHEAEKSTSTTSI